MAEFVFYAVTLAAIVGAVGMLFAPTWRSFMPFLWVGALPVAAFAAGVRAWPGFPGENASLQIALTWGMVLIFGVSVVASLKVLFLSFQGLLPAKSIGFWAASFAGLHIVTYLYPALFAHGHTQVEAILAMIVLTPIGALVGLMVGGAVWFVRQWPYFEKRGHIPPNS